MFIYRLFIKCNTRQQSLSVSWAKRHELKQKQQKQHSHRDGTLLILRCAGQQMCAIVLYKQPSGSKGWGNLIFYITLILVTSLRSHRRHCVVIYGCQTDKWRTLSAHHLKTLDSTGDDICTVCYELTQLFSQYGINQPYKLNVNHAINRAQCCLYTKQTRCTAHESILIW